MATQTWRTAALCAIVLALIYVAGDLAHLGSGGDFGFSLQTYRTALLTGSVDSVTPGSPAARAGLRVGDTVAIDPTSFASRVHFLAFNRPGDVIDLSVTRGGSVRRIRLVAVAGAPSTALANWVAIAYESIRIVFLLVAAAIAIRRPERREARALAAFFISFAFGFLGRPPWYPELISGVLLILRPLTVLYGCSQAVLFAAIYPQPSPGGIRRAIQIAAPWAFRACAVVLLVVLMPVAFFGREEVAGSTVTLNATSGTFVLYLIAAAIAFTIGYAQASPADRPRLRWISLSIVVGFAGILPTLILGMLGLPNYGPPWIFLPLSLVAIPLGTAYAILRHRVLDIGFVVSRALVYGTLSAIVLASFTLLEWLLGRVLISVSHVASVAFEALLALGLGLSMQGMHRKVDHFVDRTFFRERHEAEAALRRFTREAAFISDANILAARAVAAVDRNAGAVGAAIYLDDRSRDYALAESTLRDAPRHIGENDPAIVRLATFHEPVELRDRDIQTEGSVVPGALTFPMLVRGKLIGLLSCGEKVTSEEYAPDERDTLDALARALGHAFVTIRSEALAAAVNRTLAGSSSLDDLRRVCEQLPQQRSIETYLT